MVYRRYHHRYRATDAENQRLAQQRLLAREGINKASLLADVQPVLDTSTLALPYQVKVRPTLKSYLFVIGFFAFLSVPVFSCTGLIDMNTVHENYELAIDAIVLSIIIIIVVIVMPTTGYTLLLTRHHIEMKSFPTSRTLRWNEIALFAQDISSSGALRYEVSDNDGNRVVSWLIARGRWGDIYTVPSVSYDDYIQQMQQVLSFIAAKTDLPLYDLSKTYKGSGAI